MSLTTSRAMRTIRSRLTWALSAYLWNSGGWPRPSPAITILLVVHSVSQPSRVLTLLWSAMPSLMSFSRKASRIASEIWSQTLSGCPSHTDPLLNRYFPRVTSGSSPRTALAPNGRLPCLLQRTPARSRSQRRQQPPSCARPPSVVRCWSSVVLAGDLFDKIDDAAPQLRLLDPRERLGQRQALRGCEKVGHVGGRWRLFRAVRVRMQ